MKLEKLFVYISITLCTDSVVTYASLDKIMCLTVFGLSKMYTFIKKKKFKTKLKN